MRIPWVQVRVPKHWQLEDAFANYHGRVLYRCRFEERHPGKGEMLSLSFGGVYYAARVWLNGSYLGAHEGYFAPFEFDRTDVVVGGENELLVEVDSPREQDENDRETYRGSVGVLGWYGPAHKPRRHLQGGCSRSWRRGPRSGFGVVL